MRDIRAETKVTIFDMTADTEYIVTYPFEAEDNYISVKYINDNKDEKETSEIIFPVEVARKIIQQMRELIES